MRLGMVWGGGCTGLALLCTTNADDFATTIEEKKKMLQCNS